SVPPPRDCRARPPPKTPARATNRALWPPYGSACPFCKLRQFRLPTRHFILCPWAPRRGRPAKKGMFPMAKQVLILGASGKIGSHSARAFAHAGWSVRNYDREAGNMSAAAEGADVIVNGLNPPAYHDWEHLVPAITEQVIAAARASGATVIL